MDKDELKRRVEAGAFASNNGKVLRTINIIAGNDILLHSLHYALTEIENGDLAESLYYLQDAGYIKARTAHGHKDADVAGADYDAVEVRITARGMQLLMGYAADPAVKV